MFPICIFILCFFCVGFYVFEFLRATSNVSAENSPGKCEYTIVIDAGHGGADGGAVASDGISEKVINLEIAYKLNYILRAYGLNTVMTRTDDESIHDSNAKTLREQKVSDIHKRMSIMESDENNIFVSIHQNKFSNSSLWGTQVFIRLTLPIVQFWRIAYKILFVVFCKMIISVLLRNQEVIFICCITQKELLCLLSADLFPILKKTNCLKTRIIKEKWHFPLLMG